MTPEVYNEQESAMPHHHHSCGTIGPHAQTRYLQVFGVTMFICFVQLLGGAFSGSVSLFSDSAHVLSDGLAALIAYGVERHVQRSDLTKYKEESLRRMWMRFSGVLLLIAIGFALYETWERFQHPQPIISWSVMLVAGVGAICNKWQHRLMPHGTTTARMQHFHIHIDFWFSVAIIASGFIILLTSWLWIDPLVSAVIGTVAIAFTLYLMWTGKSLHE